MLLELEWVMRSYYGISRTTTVAVLRHLQTLPHIEIEDVATLEQTLLKYEAGLEFADAFHHSCYRQCDSVASFDDKRFARRVKRMGLSPPVIVPW